MTTVHGQWPSAPAATFWVLCLLVAAAFMLGGGARSDIQSLMVLRPVAVLALGFGLAGLGLARIRDYRFLCAMALAAAALPVLQLIPLPSGWWSALPGRSLVVEIDRAAGLAALWRPVSLVPQATLNALFALCLPLGVLVLGIRLDAERLARLLPVLLALGAASAILGLLQIVGDPDSALYFYRITNPDTPVGLFANHNHHAFLLACMLPMIAVFVEGKSDPVRFAGFAAALLLLPLILMTGSRAGVVAGVAAIAAIPLILPHRRRRDVSRRGLVPGGPRTVWAALGAIALLVVVLVVWFDKGLAFDRLFTGDIAADGRVRMAPAVIAATLAYFPLGSGLGSFESVYRVHEPDDLLGPDYMNHAHNDWLELALTGGLPAILLIIAAAIGFLLRARRLFAGELAGSPSLTLARLGLAIVLLSALASLTDYPLRVPSLAALFTVAAVWAGCPLPRTRPRVAAESDADLG